MSRVADRLTPHWQCTRTFFPSLDRSLINSTNAGRSSKIGVLWSQGICIYSGSCCFGLGVTLPSLTDTGENMASSYAVLKLDSVHAVSGTGEFATPLLATPLNGLRTSRATLMMTSNCEASSAFGSA